MLLGWRLHSASNNQIIRKTEKIKKCSGDTFDEINKCLDEYDKFCSALNSFYSATSIYMHAAENNLKQCEASNKVTGGYK